LGIISKLEKYVGAKVFTFHHITVDFLKTYENYMRGTLENSTNTIVSNLKVIKRIFNEALKDDVINLKKNPFTNYKLSWEPTTKVFLTEKEIEILEKLVLTKYSTKFNQRNLYIFACYVGGIRISDLLQLKWEHISDDHIILNTQKTGSTISIKIPTKAMEILNLYHKENEKKSDFIFPFLDQTDKLEDPKILISRLASITSHMNRGLKEIAKLAKIEKNIHFHTSRHTWATRALKKGMRIEYVSKLMGHSSIKTTQVYAKIVNEDLDNAMDLFEDKPIELEEKK
jgi:integrase